MSYFQHCNEWSSCSVENETWNGTIGQCVGCGRGTTPCETSCEKGNCCCCSVSFSVLLRIPIIIESREMVQNILLKWQQIKICFNQVNRGILTRKCLGICVLLYHLWNSHIYEIHFLCVIGSKRSKCKYCIIFFHFADGFVAEGVLVFWRCWGSEL